LAAAKINTDHPTVHEHTIRFKLAVDSASSSLKPQTAEVIKSEFNLLAASGSLTAVNSSFLSKYQDSPRHIFAALRVNQLLPSKNESKDQQAVLNTLDLSSITLEDASEGLDLLQSWKSSQVDTFRSKATSRWPEATIFQSSTKN
jgi:hypothetical protein